MDLISKKELLTQTGISYGQLYRWKREGLLPEEWFIKQSAFTGQETFFPREKILARIATILEMKDTHSLGELSEILLTKADFAINAEMLTGIPELNADFSGLLAKTLARNEFTIGELSVAYAIFLKGKETGITAETSAKIIRTALELANNRNLNDALCSIFVLDKKYHVCVTAGTVPPAFDKGISVLATIAIGETINMLRVKLEAVNTAKKMEER